MSPASRPTRPGRPPADRPDARAGTGEQSGPEAPPAAQPGAEHRPERRTTIRRAADVAAKNPYRLGDVYAEELARLREQARAEGYAAGHAEGLTAAAAVVAEVEREAAQRLAEVQARWERRLASATAALTAAASRLDETLAPTADELRDSVLDATRTLLEDLFGRELALSSSPVLDAVRRALTLLPADAPAVVRIHPDDLADVPADALAALPTTVRVVADATVERAGAVAGSGARRIDAQLGAALERVRAVLAP
ncbi:FliH/SctL family protein [Geodermatophilus sp. YIM 151500]|uniref:FliH/SctL family protein n=1 Tax=Geodermatophilus sp. YIM 151500 TaxID=2984531 RepID=UPI0021E3C037|nr:FliH/SctL family protein [Geodermatophilus sp. YIM 151500]MCV2489493.1 FliH/SctL family protein [Geodermatophilus sp. YIM 151500]